MEGERIIAMTLVGADGDEGRQGGGEGCLMVMGKGRKVMVMVVVGKVDVCVYCGGGKLRVDVGGCHRRELMKMEEGKEDEVKEVGRGR